MSEVTTITESPWAGDIISELARVTCEEVMPLHWDGDTEDATKGGDAAGDAGPAIQAADPDLP